MRGEADTRVREQIEALYRSDSRRVLATLIRFLGGFDAAEEALHDAFTSALDSWPSDGVPENPRAWLISTGRFKAIDRLRRGARFNAALSAAAEQLEASAPLAPDFGDNSWRTTGSASFLLAATRPSPPTHASPSRCEKFAAWR